MGLARPSPVGCSSPAGGASFRPLHEDAAALSHTSKPDPRSAFRAIASAAVRVLADTRLTSVVLSVGSNRQMRSIVMRIAGLMPFANGCMNKAAVPITSGHG